jgi:oligopeptide transport system substrate-binding protein
VLEIRLEHPAPYLPQLLRHYTAYPVPKHVVERFGDDWIQPDNVVVNGPYILRKWWSNYIVHLEKNPSFFDAENVALEHLYFYPITDVNAAARKVESGEAGWSSKFPANQYQALREAMPGFPRVAPWLSTTYLSFNTERTPFEDVRVRQALTMAVDREFISSTIYKTGERASYSMVPAGITNYPRTARYPWADQSMDERREQARQLLEEAGFGPDKPLSFEFSHRNTSDNPRVAVVVQNDWSKIAPWVVAELRGVELQVHYANLRAKNFDVGDGGWIADYNDPNSHLSLLETRTGPQNYSGYSNVRYDELMAQANVEVDAIRRMELMAEAEQIMLNEAPVCTIVTLNSTNLVHPDLTGYADNIEDIHRARWFGIRDS